MMETQRLQGRKIPSAFRELYKVIGGVPHLDGDYTVYGELVNGIEIIDKITAVKTNSSKRPLEDVRIIKAKLIKRKKR
jgi:peptidyl-prolyl cis-trans isomerase B (cyclophilin B)